MTEVVSEEPISPTLQAFARTPRVPFSPAGYLAYKEDKRKRLKIIELIERFYHQIRYGCTASVCTTTTCRAYRDQKARGVPYRVPTPVTARAIAAYLAALDNPVPHLCNNTPAPKPNPFDLAFPTSRALFFLLETDGRGFAWDSSKIKASTDDVHAVADWCAKAEFEEWMASQACSDTTIDLKQPYPYKPDTNIDTKSFAQRLFISFAWKWYPFIEHASDIPRPDSLVCQPDPGFTPVGKIFHELEKSTGTEQDKCLSLGAQNGFRLSDMAYHDISHLLGSENITDYWLALMKDNSPSRIIPHNTIATIFSTPSLLMYYGLNEFSTDDEDLVSELAALKYTKYPGLQFLDERYSQSFVALYLEIEMLSSKSNLEIEKILEWLAVSMKCTAFNPQAEQKNIPSSIAAHIVAVSIAAISASVFTLPTRINSEDWNHFEKFRREGHVTFDSFNRPRMQDRNHQSHLHRWALAYEEPTAQYLMKLVLRSFASWSYTSTKILIQDNEASTGISGIIEDECDFYHRLQMFLSHKQLLPDELHVLNLGLLEWCRTIFLRNWDGQAIFQWNTDVGAAIDFMRWMYNNREDFTITGRHFAIDVLLDRMDYVEASQEWMQHKMSALSGHLFDFPWLFSDGAKVTIFRSINLLRMFSAYESSVTTNELVRRLTGHIPAAAKQLLNKLSTSMDSFLVLDIRRDNILGDSFNQLWRRQKRELFRPLKVRMGMDEGEEGVDMGGVQQEFFRLAIADALKPDNGLFTVDERTRMTWFQPMSVAPLHQYTLIGLLFGLALYNGITLSVTFPLAFYRKLLGLRNALFEDIEDGWPELCIGLHTMLHWNDGKVEDVFLRTYSFSFEASGVVQNVDMISTKRDDEWPPRRESFAQDSNDRGASKPIPIKESEPEMVTNKNRLQYVSDYIFWLTEKSIAPQFEAFAAGFFLPLQKKACSLFQPWALKLLMEGNPSIDIMALQKTTRYEDWPQADHPRIKDFWEIVKDLSPDQHKKLLEFVTASPRVPVRGMSEVTFIIQRNGVGDERLPTSMTCFGRLLLPEYSSKEIMAQKLRLAIENSTGFGTQ